MQAVCLIYILFAVKLKEPVIKNVELTRPFAFLIYDRSNDEILFMGKVMTVS